MSLEFLTSDKQPIEVFLDATIKKNPQRFSFVEQIVAISINTINMKQKESELSVFYSQMVRNYDDLYITTSTLTNTC